MQEVGQLAVLIGAALAQFAGDVFGHVARPSLRCVEANHPDRIAVLAIQQIVNDTFEFGVFNVGLPPRATEPAEVIEYEYLDQRPERLRGTDVYATPTHQETDAAIFQRRSQMGKSTNGEIQNGLLGRECPFRASRLARSSGLVRTGTVNLQRFGLRCPPTEPYLVLCLAGRIL